MPVCLDRPRQSLTSRALAGRRTPEAGGSGLAAGVTGLPGLGGTLRLLLLLLLLNAAAGVVAGALALALVTGARRLMAWSAVKGWFEGVSVDRGYARRSAHFGVRAARTSPEVTLVHRIVIGGEHAEKDRRRPCTRRALEPFGMFLLDQHVGRRDRNQTAMTSAHSCLGT